MSEPKDPEELLAARYGSAVDWVPPQWNDTLDLIHRHRSVRKWLDQPVSDDTIRTIVSAAQSAATSSNKQIISVIAVRDPELKKGLAQICRQMTNHIEQAAAVLVWSIDYSVARETAGDSQLGALEYADEVGLGFLDAGIAAQNAAVAAESLGLGTVYLGSVRNDVEQVQQLLGIPETVIPVVGLEIGYPDPTELAGIKPRLPQEAVLHWDSYNTASRSALIDAYDERLNAYFSRYGEHERWSQQLVARLASTGILKSNRQFLRRVLEKAGFSLK